MHRSISAAAMMATLSLVACGGGGSGSSSPGTGIPGSGSSNQQSKDVTPTFTFVLPRPGSTTSSSSRKPQYVSPNSTLVTITLVSSSANPSLNGTSVSTDLTSPGVCKTNVSTSAYTCTVSGPPVPPGTDEFDAKVYGQALQTFTSLAPATTAPSTPEPVLLSQTSSQATPVQPEPTVTISPGAANSVILTLYGVPGILTITPVTPIKPTSVRRAAANTAHSLAIGSGTSLDADTPSSVVFPLTVADASGNPITGEYSVPVTVTDNDTAGGFGTSLFVGTPPPAPGKTSTAPTPVLTQTINSDTDLANLGIAYGGIAEAAPTFKATASTAVGSGSVSPYQVYVNQISVNPNEVDLYTGGPNAVNVAVNEYGWTDAPYNQNLSVDTSAPCTVGTAADTYTLTAPSTVEFTDTTPATPAAGSCVLTLSDYAGDTTNTNTLTLTYATTNIGVQAKKRSR